MARVWPFGLVYFFIIMINFFFFYFLFVIFLGLVL